LFAGAGVGLTRTGGSRFLRSTTERTRTILWCTAASTL